MQKKESISETKTIMTKYGFNGFEERINALNLLNLKNKKILDIGTGMGFSGIYAASKFQNEVISIDISKTALKMGYENLKKIKGFEILNIQFIQIDAKQLPFEPNSFDGIIIHESLHHMTNINKIISEAERVCKSRGKIIITEFNKEGMIIAKELHSAQKENQIFITQNNKNKDKQHNTSENNVDLDKIEKILMKNFNISKTYNKYTTNYLCIKK